MAVLQEHADQRPEPSPHARRHGRHLQIDESRDHKEPREGRKSRGGGETSKRVHTSDNSNGEDRRQ